MCTERAVGLFSIQEPEILIELLTQVLQSASGRNHEFASEGGFWKINLTRTFIALTANKYEKWEAFKEKLAIHLNALIDVYSPTHFSRIGLRYKDVIRRSVLHLEDVSWTELLQSYILGVLSAPGIGTSVKNFESRHEIGLSDGESLVRVITKFVEAADNGEICDMIDSDFYDTKRRVWMT